MFDLLWKFTQFALEVAVQTLRERSIPRATDEDLKHRTQEIRTWVGMVRYDDGSLKHRALVQCGDAVWAADYSSEELAQRGKDIFVGEAMNALNA